MSHMFCDQFTKCSNKLSICTVRNALKLRHGTFWNAKLAKRFQKPYLGKTSDGRCLLCKNPDSATHVLGACTHKLIKGRYIERHNEAVASTGKAIMEMAQDGGLAVLVADAGRLGKVTGLCANSKVPNEVLLALLKNVPEDMLRRMRPDILLFERESGDTLPIALQDLKHTESMRRYKLHLVDVGFCTELGTLRNSKKNMSTLHSAANLGDASYDVQLHMLIFGSTGGMFSLTTLHLKRLRVSHSTTNSSCKTCIGKLTRGLSR